MYHDNKVQQRHGTYDRRSQLYNRQEMDQRRYSQTSQLVDNNNVNVLNALENYSTKQALTQSTLIAFKSMRGVTERPQSHGWTKWNYSQKIQV